MDEDEDSEIERLESSLDTAIESVVGDGVATRWTAQIEVMNAATGERDLWLLQSTNMRPWDVTGFLHWAQVCADTEGDTVDMDTDT